MLILGFRAIGLKIKNQHLNQIYTVICDLVSYRAGEIRIIWVKWEMSLYLFPTSANMHQIRKRGMFEYIIFFCFSFYLYIDGIHTVRFSLVIAIKLIIFI